METGTFLFSSNNITGPTDEAIRPKPGHSPGMGIQATGAESVKAGRISPNGHH